MPYPLEGVKILDLSRLLPGPYCSLILADLGAEVLKVEDPQGGDYLRWSPPFLNEYSAEFHSINRNKKSIKLQLKADEGRQIFLELVKSHDVVLESFRPGAMERLGLSYDELKRVNPRLVMCSISGYGQHGPYSQRAGHDLNYLAVAGACEMTGIKKGSPVIPGFQLGDVAGGSLFAAIAILAALISRHRTGEGRYIDTSMTDGIMAFLTMHFARYFQEPQLPKRSEELLNGGYPCYQVYETKDNKWMSLGALEPKFWGNFCAAVGREDLTYSQFDKEDSAREEVQAIFRQKTQEEWVDFFRHHDACCEPVNTMEQVLEHPQLVERQLFFELAHPTEGKSRYVKSPFKMSGMEGVPGNPAPCHGEHTVEVLQSLGCSEERIRELEEKGVI